MNISKFMYRLELVLDMTIVLPLWLLLTFVYFVLIKRINKEARSMPSWIKSARNVTDTGRFASSALWSISLVLVLQTLKRYGL